MTQRRVVPLSSILFLLLSTFVAAQMPDSVRGRNDLQSIVYIDDDASKANEITPMFRFSMHYDSSRTIFKFGECKLNGTKIHFPTWHYDSTVNTMEANQLSNHSRTSDVRLVTGDTISFYRELGWYNPLIDEQDEDGYYASDSLDYAIELVRSSSDTRLALIDSIGVLPRPTPGYPDLHGSRPIMAHVHYVVPPTFGGDTAYIRVKLYVRGDGPHYTVRRDEFTVNPSRRLTDSLWLEYIDEYGGGLGKRTVQELTRAERSMANTSLLRVSPNPTSGEISIDYTAGNSSASTAIVIYDMQGRAIFMPTVGVKPAGLNHATYTFTTNGTYYVALMNNNDLVTTKKITVRR